MYISKSANATSQLLGLLYPPMHKEEPLLFEDILESLELAAATARFVQMAGDDCGRSRLEWANRHYHLTNDEQAVLMAVCAFHTGPVSAVTPEQIATLLTVLGQRQLFSGEWADDFNRAEKDFAYLAEHVLLTEQGFINRKSPVHRFVQLESMGGKSVYRIARLYTSDAARALSNYAFK